MLMGVSEDYTSPYVSWAFPPSALWTIALCVGTSLSAGAHLTNYTCRPETKDLSIISSYRFPVGLGVCSHVISWPDGSWDLLALWGLKPWKLVWIDKRHMFLLLHVGVDTQSHSEAALPRCPKVDSGSQPWEKGFLTSLYIFVSPSCNLVGLFSKIYLEVS